MAYLPEFNMSLVRGKGTYNPVPVETVRLRPIVSNPKEFMKMSFGLAEIDRELGLDGEGMFVKENIVYSVGAGIVFIIIGIVVLMYFLLKYKKGISHLMA